jgi:integral membrane sensor domain MASE1
MTLFHVYAYMMLTIVLSVTLGMRFGVWWCIISGCILGLVLVIISAIHEHSTRRRS